jgi:hypothetical protein
MIDCRDIRDDLVHVLPHDLVGPFPIGPYQDEVLTKPPSTSPFKVTFPGISPTIARSTRADYRHVESSSARAS